MKESEFIDQNTDKWLEYESIIKQNHTDPDKLSEVYIQVTDDLSHSRSHYPNRSVRVYLNDLASKIFDKLGRRRKFDAKLIKDFYMIEVPQLMYLARREMLISFVVFILSIGIGIYSSIQNPEFPAQVLGERYVQMTQDNISKGEAMDVYAGGNGMDGFMYILINNAKIDVLMLGMGVFFSFGALWVLIRNGIMVGVFQFFFFQHGGFRDSLLTIWLHGTIEITTIGLMGGVALLAGKGLLFPGNYTRYQSFRLSAGNATKLLLMVLPFTVVAAVIEAFITRMTGMPDLIKGFFILISLAIVVFYFFAYPRMVHRRVGTNPIHERLRRENPTMPIDLSEIKAPAKVISEAFVTYKKNFGRNVAICSIAAVGYVLLRFYFFNEYHQWGIGPAVVRFFDALDTSFSSLDLGIDVLPENLGYQMFNFGYFGFWAAVLLFVNARYAFSYRLKWSKSGQYLGVTLITAVAGYLYFRVSPKFPISVVKSFAVVWMLMFSVAFMQVMHYFKEGKSHVLKTILTRGFAILPVWLALSAITFFIHLGINSGLTFLIVYTSNDLLPFGNEVKEYVSIGIQSAIYFILVLGLMPLYYYAIHYFNLSLIEKYEAPGLKEEVNNLSFKSN